MVMLIYSPFPSYETARDAAQRLLAEKLVACVNLQSAIESHYWWQGAVVQADEVLLLAKTTESLAAHAAERLAACHPYDCPAILTIAASANTAFAAHVASTLLAE